MCDISSWIGHVPFTYEAGLKQNEVKLQGSASSTLAWRECKYHMICSFGSFFLYMHLFARHISIMKRAPMETQIVTQLGNHHFEKTS